MLSALRRGTLLFLPALLLAADPAMADEFGGVEFPDGIRSFADVVVEYAPVIVNDRPTEPHRDDGNATGPPDYDGVNNCPLGDCSFVSLGDGGSLTLRFTDNVLTGSGDAGLDLWIFEVGSDVEATFVEVSADGESWTPVGQVAGATAGIDLDAYGFGVEDAFTHVRLTDDPDEGGQTGRTVGADIDAVGAISSTAGCELAGVSPAQPWSPGDVIEISGDGFVDGAVPVIGGEVAEPFTIVSGSLIEATVPPVGAGTFDLRIELPNGQICELIEGVVSGQATSWGTLKHRYD